MGIVEPLRLEIPHLLPALPRAADQSRIRQHAKVLGDRLARYVRFALSCVIDPGPPDDRRTISRSRVSSPSAAKSGAASRTRVAMAALLLDMAANVLHLRRPPLAVHLERLGAPTRGDVIETGFDNPQRGPLSASERWNLTHVAARTSTR